MQLFSLNPPLFLVLLCGWDTGFGAYSVVHFETLDHVEGFSSCVVCTATATDLPHHGPKAFDDRLKPLLQLKNKFTPELSLCLATCLLHWSGQPHSTPSYSQPHCCCCVNSPKVDLLSVFGPLPPPMPSLVSLGLRLVLVAVGWLDGWPPWQAAAPPPPPPPPPPQRLSLHPSYTCWSPGAREGVKLV